MTRSSAPISAAARLAVKERSGGRCEARIPGVCVRAAVHLHHVVLRSRGGDNTPSNLAHLCSPCHDWTHAHPLEATERGLMARATPKETS